MAWWDTVFGDHPFGFEQRILGQTHENGIEGTGLESCLAAEFVAVTPRRRAAEEALKEKECLRREAGRFHGQTLHI
jgi:hypothetical protein